MLSAQTAYSTTTAKVHRPPRATPWVNAPASHGAAEMPDDHKARTTTPRARWWRKMTRRNTYRPDWTVV
jgi:hypothetical protein